MLSNKVPVDAFEGFAQMVEPRLREALSATLGSDLGRDAAAEALAYGWEHWARVSGMDNPAGYLYAVGRDRGRRLRPRRPVALMPADPVRTPWVEPGLPGALSQLSVQQRVAVMLLYCFEWTMSEVAELLGSQRARPYGASVRAGVGRVPRRERLLIDVCTSSVSSAPILISANATVPT